MEPRWTCGCTQGAIACRPLGPIGHRQITNSPGVPVAVSGPGHIGSERGFPDVAPGRLTSTRGHRSTTSARVGRGRCPEPSRRCVDSPRREFLGPSREHASKDSASLPLMRDHAYQGEDWEMIFEPRLLARPFMTKPICKGTNEMAPSITPAVLAAATRPRRPTTSPSEPRSSARRRTPERPPANRGRSWR
jgi:hypothetical protein